MVLYENISKHSIIYKEFSYSFIAFQRKNNKPEMSDNTRNQSQLFSKVGLYFYSFPTQLIGFAVSHFLYIFLLINKLTLYYVLSVPYFELK